MKAFFHASDLDGHCSGAIIKYKFPECEMIPIDYGDEFPWTTIQPSETIYMVDFSLQPFEKMVKLQRLFPNLIWIDHHKSAIEAYKDWNHTHHTHSTYLSIQGIRKVGIGACQLVWEYLFPNTPVPKFVKLLAEYDVWNHSDPDTLPFQYGMRLKETDPSTEEGMKIWYRLIAASEFDLDSIIKDGRTVLKYQEQIDGRYCERFAFETEFEGLKAIAVNKGIANSNTFKSIKGLDKYDLMITFCMIGPEKGWTVSLYTTKPDVDVSVIAKKYGGGGHKGAAGFQCKELPIT